MCTPIASSRANSVLPRQKEEMELRAAMRSRASTRPKRRAGGAGGAARRDDSEDEGGVSLAAIKNKYKQGQKGMYAPAEMPLAMI